MPICVGIYLGALEKTDALVVGQLRKKMKCSWLDCQGAETIREGLNVQLHA